MSAYAREVLDGRIVAGPHIRNACRRHFDDLEHGAKRGLHFDHAAAERAFRFFETILKLNGGQFEGKPFVLHPPQAFIIGSLFGWKRQDGNRRFNRAYVEMGKGNGKSPLVGGVGIYGMIGDNEPRAEIYAAASKRDQAMVLFRDARAMVQQSPDLEKVCVVSGGDHQPNIAFLPNSSFFRPISSDKGQSGPRPHMALCDEVHEHQSRETMEMLERGFKFRLNPLLFMITNSGYDKESVCWEEHEHAVKVAAQTIEDDTTFSFVCSLDDGEDPLEDPACWVKANPLLGVIMREETIEKHVKQAKQLPGKRNEILRLHFCMWTDSESVWMAREAWEKCEVEHVDPARLTGRQCYGGLDLSGTTDLTACARVWPAPDGSFDAIVDFWKPADTLAKHEDKDRVPYRLWRDQGYLATTPGSSVDYAHIVPRLAEMHSINKFAEFAFDRWGMKTMIKELAAAGVELPLEEFGQGFKDMAPAVTALETAILNGKLRVQFNPVLRWNVASAVIETDPAGNRKFTKKKATGRIDGAVALAMALGRAAAAPAPKQSIYETRGIL